MVDNEHLKSILKKLQNDERLKKYEGYFTPYNRNSYKKMFNDTRYTEIMQCGFKVSFLINKDNFIPNCVSFYIWVEEFNNDIYFKNSIGNEIFKFDKKSEQKIVDKIIEYINKREAKIIKKVI